MTQQRDRETPFYVQNGRAMVSLGPLARTKFCTYSCPFCYVHAHFKSYASLTVSEITTWLANVVEPFDIIYVSGDTDSFAPPRADEGMALLTALSAFDVDLLFTTRALLQERHLAELAKLREDLRRRGKLLFGCVSVSQLTFPHLEPHPIPSPDDRLQQLKAFHELGLVSVLAARPFLPMVPVEEYLRIVDRAHAFVDVVLGEKWYADKEGILETNVFGGPAPSKIPFVDHVMDFDDNRAVWKVYEAHEIETAVSSHCVSLGLPFFMRSGPAIDWARATLAPARGIDGPP